MGRGVAAAALTSAGGGACAPAGGAGLAWPGLGWAELPAPL